MKDWYDSALKEPWIDDIAHNADVLAHGELQSDLRG
jgi:hypothetical protein